MGVPERVRAVRARIRAGDAVADGRGGDWDVYGAGVDGDDGRLDHHGYC